MYPKMIKIYYKNQVQIIYFNEDGTYKKEEWLSNNEVM